MRILFWLAAAMEALCVLVSVSCLVSGLLALPGGPATGVVAFHRCPERRAKERTPLEEPAPFAATPPWRALSRIGLPMFARRLRRSRMDAPVLLDDLADHARADRATTLPDGESQPLVHGDRLDQFDLHLDVVAGHDHLDAVGQLGHA